MKKVAFIILSYNGRDLTEVCIESIRKNCTDICYEIIVVDNASEDGSREWLQQQKDLKLLFNDENQGFPRGCNQGIALADPKSDIFLLNNDTLVPPNSVRLLMEALYSSERVGAVGPVTNWASNDQVVVETREDWRYLEFAERYNSDEPAYEQKAWLVGFALLIRRSVLDEVGLLDERFTPGNYEDNDICWRIRQAGYDTILCHNSFIFHYGGSSFCKKPEAYEKIMCENAGKFTEKWGVHPHQYSMIKQDMIRLFQPNSPRFRLLEVGCGTGVTLAAVKYCYPESDLYGMEWEDRIKDIAIPSVATLWWQEPGHMDFPEGDFDYILLSQVLENTQKPIELLRKLATGLKEEGVLIGSVYSEQMQEERMTGCFRHKYTEQELLLKLRLAGYQIDQLVTITDERNVLMKYGFLAHRQYSGLWPLDRRELQQILDQYVAGLLEDHPEKLLVLQTLEEELGDTADFAYLMGLVYMRNDLYYKALRSFMRAVTYPSAYRKGANSFLAYEKAAQIQDYLGETEEAARLHACSMKAMAEE